MADTQENAAEMIEARLVPREGPGAVFGAMLVDPRSTGLDSSLAAADSVANAILRIDASAHDGLTPRERVLEGSHVADAVAIAQAGLETITSQQIPTELDAAARAVREDLGLVLPRLAVPDLGILDTPRWEHLVDAAHHLDQLAAKMRKTLRAPLEVGTWTPFLTFEVPDAPNGSEVARLLSILARQGADIAGAEVGLLHEHGPVVSVRAPRTAAA